MTDPTDDPGEREARPMMDVEHAPTPDIPGLPTGSIVLGFGLVNGPAVERINGQYRWLGVSPEDGSDGPMEDGWYMVADELQATNAVGALVFVPAAALSPDPVSEPVDGLREALAALFVETKRKYRTTIATPGQVGAIAALTGARAVPEVAAAVRELASSWDGPLAAAPAEDRVNRCPACQFVYGHHAIGCTPAARLAARRSGDPR